MATRFQAFTPSYENISNRISRLKHNSTSHSALPTSSYHYGSIPKNNNVLTLDTTTSPKRRVSPTAMAFNEDKFMQSGKFTGRVTKNVGLKKYNQRQLKEVMQCKITTSLRPQNYQNYRFKTEATPRRQIAVNSSSKAWKWQKTDEIKIKQEQLSSPNKLEFQKQLIPGKLYSRSYLSSLLRQ